MRITWRDAITTVSTAGAVILERAYFHNYDWPLVSSMRWVIGGLAVLAFANLIVGFAFDKFSTVGWDLLGIFLGVALATLTTLGLVYVISDYVVLMMLSAIFIWLASLSHHFVEHGSTTHTPQTMVHA